MRKIGQKNKREVRGTGERNQESRGQSVTEKDRMTLEEGMGALGGGVGNRTGLLSCNL